MHKNHKSKKKKSIVFIYESSIYLNRIIKKTKKKHKQCNESISKNKISHRIKIEEEMKEKVIGET